MGRISEIHSKLVNKEISAAELAKGYLDKIKAENTNLNAFVAVLEEEAIKEAERVDGKIAKGEKIGALEGVPFALKDNICTKNILTTCCSNILKNYRPIYNATAYQKLKEQGSVFLGKNNMDEFAMGNSCENYVFGATKNPVNFERVAGGSSGGSAAAVKAGLCAFSLGSDTGGSVRQPAAFCGCVGFKPSYGAVSRYGLIAYASGFDQIGILSNTVEDAALVFDAVKGKDEKDSTTVDMGNIDTVACLRNSIKGRRVGVVEELFAVGDTDVKASLEKGLEVLLALGAEVEFVSIPQLSLSLPAYYILACAQASSNLGRYDSIRFGTKAESYSSIHDMICKTRSQGFSNEVKKRIMMGTFVLSEGHYDEYYKKAEAVRAKVERALDEAFEKYDVLISPTTPTTAFRLGQVSDDKVESYRADICTCIANLAGIPAVSVPFGEDRFGLPTAVQFMGKKYKDSDLLNVACCFEDGL